MARHPHVVTKIPCRIRFPRLLTTRPPIHPTDVPPRKDTKLAFVSSRTFCICCTTFSNCLLRRPWSPICVGRGKGTRAGELPVGTYPLRGGGGGGAPRIVWRGTYREEVQAWDVLRSGLLEQAQGCGDQADAHHARGGRIWGHEESTVVLFPACVGARAKWAPRLHARGKKNGGKGGKRRGVSVGRGWAGWGLGGGGAVVARHTKGWGFALLHLGQADHKKRIGAISKIQRRIHRKAYVEDPKGEHSHTHCGSLFR